VPVKVLASFALLQAMEREPLQELEKELLSASVKERRAN